MVFSYSTPQSCDSSSAPVGAQLEQRGGVLRYRGSRRLDSIVTMVRSSPSGTYRTVRTTALTYDAEASSCFRDRGALRLLTSIQESAVSPTGETTTMPAVTFTYGPLERNLTASRAFGRLGTELPALHAGTRANREVRHFSPTLEATLIDIDGDGRLDRVTEWRFEDCAFQWDRNTGNGFGDDGGVVAFPTFRHVPGSECSLAGHIINANLERPACSEEENNDSYLSYRFLDMNSDGLSDLVAAVHYNPHYYDPALDAIAQTRWGLDQACLASRAMCSDVSEVCATDDCDIDDEETDRQLAAASKVPCHTLMNEPGEEPDEADDGGGEPPPTTCRPQHRQPLTACGTYPWEIYWNLGNGEFNMDEPTLVFQPLPLESDFGDSSLGNSGRLGRLTSTDHAIIDLDGDGYLDGAIRSTSNPNVWTVFRGDGSGTLRPRSDGLPYLWSVPSGPPRMYQTRTFNELEGGNVLGHVLSGSSLMDMNGDGFVDLLWADPTLSPSDVVVFLNKRNGFRSGGGDLLDGGTSLGTPSVRESLTIGQGEVDFIDYGTRTSLRFPVDYDQDGWVDFFEKNPPPSEATRFRYGNGGGGLGSGRTLDATEAAGFPQVLDSPNLDHNWRIFRDFIDLDGDGVTEFVEPANGDIDGDGNADLWRMRQDQRDGSPMRLLRRIDNGAGGQIAVTYRASTDPQIDIPGTNDQLGMPSHTWLVQQVATSGLVDQAGFDSVPLRFDRSGIGTIAAATASGASRPSR